MLDIKYIRDNVDNLRKAITDKRVDLDLDALLDLDTQRRNLLQETESFQATKNAFSKEIPTLSEEDKAAKLLEMQEIDKHHTEALEKLRSIEAEYNNLMLLVPNIPSPETPIGKDDTDNVPWSYWSPELGHVDPTDTDKVAQIPPTFTFDIKDHAALGKDLDLIDIDRGTEVSGFRGYFLKNELVLMHQGLMFYAMEKLRSKGFTIMQTPTLVREFALTGSGHFPTGRAEIYQVGNAANLESEDKEKQFLAGTSEPALIGYYANQILEESQLPIQVSGISACYRSEVGSYGKDTKGLYRVKEFLKVEQVVICKADMVEGENWLAKLREISEEILQELKLPYRVLNICTGDMGAGKYKMYDIETWMPARQGYGETHSDSNFTDWQARRLDIRYRDSEGKIQYAYTLNNTAVASPRILIALLENYQLADGSVKVPEVLQKYVGTDVITAKAKK
ncbi:MAG TPA: serine--tRNA ligase [Patescibacteria group bacterium]|jgi:seryl-tRNA synthetase|nr:serine--tRNA ligase [Patescibacteria group bacterium]